MRTLSALAICLLAGCGGRQLEPRAAAPAWVLWGSGPSATGGVRTFLGVGGAEANERFPERLAENRARAEISKLLEIYSASMVKECMDADPTAPRGDGPHVEDRIDLIVASYRIDGSGAVLRERWTGADGRLYALAALELETLKATAQRSTVLNAPFRRYMAAHAERFFDDLAAESERARNAATTPANGPE